MSGCGGALAFLISKVAILLHQVHCAFIVKGGGHIAAGSDAVRLSRCGRYDFRVGAAEHALQPVMRSIIGLKLACSNGGFCLRLREHDLRYAGSHCFFQALVTTHEQVYGL